MAVPDRFQSAEWCRLWTLTLLDYSTLDQLGHLSEYPSPVHTYSNYSQTSQLEARPFWLSSHQIPSKTFARIKWYGYKKGKQWEVYVTVCCCRTFHVFGDYGVLVWLIPRHCAFGFRSSHTINPCRQWAAINSWYSCFYIPGGSKKISSCQKQSCIKKKKKATWLHKTLSKRKTADKHKIICRSVSAFNLMEMWSSSCLTLGCKPLKYNNTIPIGSFCPAMGAMLIHCWSTLG